MTDEVTTTPEVEQVDTSQVSEQDQPVLEDQQQSEEVTAQPEVVEESQEQAPRQTRAEKRLHQLLDKGKPQQQSDPYTDYLNSMPEVTPSEDGTITPEQLQQMVARETAKNVALAREMDTYHASVNEFTADVEAVGEQLEKDFGNNKPLANKLNGMLTTMIEKANVRYNAQGQQVLVPSIKPSQLYGQLKEALSLAQGLGTEQANAHLAQQIAEGALTPSTRQTQEVDVSTLSQNEIWKNPRAAREAMRAKLQVAQD